MGQKDDDNMVLWKELQNKESFCSLCKRPEPSTGNWGVTLVMVRIRKCLCPFKRSLQYTATYTEECGGGHKEVCLSKLEESNAFGYTLEFKSVLLGNNISFKLKLS